MDAVDSPAITTERILEVLHDVVDPELHENVVELGMVRRVTVDGGRVTVEIALTTAACPLRGQLRDDVAGRVGCLDGVDEVVVTTGVMGADERARLMSRARRSAQDRATPTLGGADTRASPDIPQLRLTIYATHSREKAGIGVADHALLGKNAGNHGVTLY